MQQHSLRSATRGRRGGTAIKYIGGHEFVRYFDKYASNPYMTDDLYVAFYAARKKHYVGAKTRSPMARIKGYFAGKVKKMLNSRAAVRARHQLPDPKTPLSLSNQEASASFCPSIQ